MENKKNDTLDIVALIEKNPITRLSKNYQSNLVTKIKSKFTGKEQQLFVGSFYCYLNCSKTDFIIDLDDVWKWIGFARKDHAKVVVTKNFVEKIDYKILLPKLREQDSLDHGGNNKEKILMTTATFKKLCLKAQTKKADEIHDYYLKLEELLHETVDEETEDLRKQLVINDSQHKKDLKMKRHTTLIEFFKAKRNVYLGEIVDGEFFKIGSSEGIDIRGKRLQDVYENMYFLEIFECVHFREVEKNILHDPIIIKNLYREPIKKDGSVSFEVVKLSNDFTYDQLLSIVKKHVASDKNLFLTPVQLLENKKIDSDNKKIDFEQQKLNSEIKKLDMEQQKLDSEIKKLDMEQQKLDIEQQKLIIFNKILCNDISDGTIKNNIFDNSIKNELSNMLKDMFKDVSKKSSVSDELIKDYNTTNDNLIEKLEESEEELEEVEELKEPEEKELKKVKKYNPNNDIILDADINRNAKKPQGRKIQKIDQNDLKKIVTLYDSMMYLLRCPENARLKRFNIIKAIETNTIYQGYRWNFVEKNEDPNISIVKATDLSKKEYKADVVLQLDEEKTKILNSYTTKIKLATELKITKIKLNKIIENNLKHNGHYYVLHQQCPESLLKGYDGSTSRTIKTGVSSIKQINPITKDEIIFNTFDEISVKLGIKPRTIKKAIEDKIICNGSIWKYCE